MIGDAAEEIESASTNYERVRDAIRDGITGGFYKQGSRLKVAELCRQHGASSNPVREALQHLQGEGLVVVSPNQGATVRVINTDLIRYIYEIGEGVDGIVARRCATIAQPFQIEKLRELAAGVQQADLDNDEQERTAYNTAFHEEIALISGNIEAMDIRRRHKNLIRVIRRQCGYSPTRFEKIHFEHLSIVEAIAAADPEAAEYAARVHRRRSCEDMLLRYHGFPDNTK